jgi:hypothetical protein
MNNILTREGVPRMPDAGQAPIIAHIDDLPVYICKLLSASYCSNLLEARQGGSHR